MAEGRRRRASSRSARPEIAAGDRIVDAALGLIARRGWRNLSLAAVASEANLPVLEVYRHFPSKIAIL
jgi:AcrR family transcriptional regulator